MDQQGNNKLGKFTFFQNWICGKEQHIYQTFFLIQQPHKGGHKQHRLLASQGWASAALFVNIPLVVPPPPFLEVLHDVTGYKYDLPNSVEGEKIPESRLE